MSMRTCPECGSSVKLENMKRHFANVHPGKDASAAISAEEHREIQRAQRSGGPAFYTRRSFQIVVVLVVVLGVGYAGLPYILGSHFGPSFNVVAYCGAEGTVAHYHPLVEIYFGATHEALPAEIGLVATETNPSYGCSTGGHAIHTHDASGVVHVELPVIPPSPPTLGDFFTIWGQPLTSASVWSFSGPVRATMYDSDTHTFSDFSSNPSGIPLYEPAGGPTANPYAIPPDLIWNGTLGSGQSGGLYSGEVIWLNVTA